MIGRIPVGIQDFTFIETIFLRRLRTVRLPLAAPVGRPHIRPGHLSLRTMRLELNRRFMSKPHVVREHWVSLPETLGAIFAQYDDAQEHLILLILTPARVMVGFKLIASDVPDHVRVDRRVLTRAALLLGASGMMVAHNHPAGQLEPSKHDVEFTAELIDSARHLDLDFVDHYIYLPNGTCVSIRERYPNLFPAEPPLARTDQLAWQRSARRDYLHKR
ncbi:MAG TPA: JAB domain-containing protein [Polyangia bacterium]|nr:JAB domain-containing protein [Polyangia bacterium]